MAKQKKKNKKLFPASRGQEKSMSFPKKYPPGAPHESNTIQILLGVVRMMEPSMILMVVMLWGGRIFFPPGGGKNDVFCVITVRVSFNFLCELIIR